MIKAIDLPRAQRKECLDSDLACSERIELGNGFAESLREGMSR